MKCEICLKQCEKTYGVENALTSLCACSDCCTKIDDAIRAIGDEARHDDNIRSAFDSALRGDDASALEHIDAAGESKNEHIYGKCVCGKVNTANNKCEVK